jgi:hypothetical protein
MGMAGWLEPPEGLSVRIGSWMWNAEGLEQVRRKSQTCGRDTDCALAIV